MEPIKEIKQYKVESTLGSGGMGTVYKAFDTVLERHVAIKVMHKHMLGNDDNAARFMNEARAAARLQHPNIVTVYEIGESEYGQYIVMEHVDGTPLTDILRAEGVIETRRALSLTSQILSGLHAAHSMNILHRDIKTENVLITSSDQVKILDFGIAKISTGASLTVVGDVLGTVEYMAPEQMMGGVVDARADVYAVGVVAYQMLTNRLPFMGDTPVAILYKQLNEDPVAPSHYQPQIPRDLDAAVLKALARDTEKRWESAESFEQALIKQQQHATRATQTMEGGIQVEFDESDLELEADDINLRTTFIGREKEYRQLLGHYHKAEKGLGQTVMLMGEAGVGKSTIAGQLQSYARSRRALTLYGACLYQEGMDAYLPYIDALRKYFSSDIRDLSEDARANLKAVVQERVPLLMEFTDRFKTSFAKPGGQEAQSRAQNPDLFEGIHLLVSLLSTIQPVVFVLDDLQWADEASLRLFHYLARQVTQSRVLLLGISRTDRYDLQNNGKPAMIVDVLSRMKREGVHEEISVKRFTRETCDQLIDKTLGNTILSDEFYDKVFRETRGNPFFVLETLKFLQDTNKIYFENDAWYDRQEELTGINVPNRVEDVFVRRLNALSENEREIMQTAAIIGYKFDASILAKLMELSKIKLLKTLQSIDRDLNILIGTEVGFQFEHPMLRDMLYNEVPQALRREYHMMIADEMERMYGDDYGAFVGEAAEHFRHGGRYKKALPLLYQAANRAFKINAYREAGLFYEAMSSALEKGSLEYPEGISQKDHLLRLAICYEETARWQDSVIIFKQMLDFCREHDDFPGQVDALRRSGRVHEKLGEYDEAVVLLEECLEIIALHPVPNNLSRIYNSLGVIALQKGEYEVALGHFHKTTEVVDHEMGEYDRAHALTNIGITHNIKGEHDTALQYYTNALTLYETLKDDKGRARIYHNLGMTHSDLENWQDSINAFEDCFKLAVTLEDKQLRALTLLNMGKAYARMENNQKAEETARKALKIFRRAGDMLNIAETYHVLGLAAKARKDYPAARKLYHDSLKIYEERQNEDGILDVCESLAALHLDTGSKEQAADHLQRALEIAESQNLQERKEILRHQLKDLQGARVKQDDEGETEVISAVTAQDLEKARPEATPVPDENRKS